MAQLNRRPLSRLALLAMACLLLISAPGCTLSLIDIDWGGLTPPTSVPAGPAPTPIPSADVTFRVTLPEPLLPGETLSLSLLEEVTGLALTASYYPMQPVDPLTYTVALPLPINTVVKYRYVLLAGLPIMEDTSADVPIRYRLLSIDGPSTVTDIVASWGNKPFAGGTGSLQGTVLDAATGAPVPNLMVAAGGMQALTDSAGAFLLNGLPKGTHNMVVYALDGSFQTFQQGATVDIGYVTRADARVRQAPLVTISFSVALPANTVPGAPVRIAGNLLQFGNSFADLQGGLSSVPGRMPVLTVGQDGRASVSMRLPVGADLHYTYTLGDGFWNAEHRKTGEFNVRHLIVPGNDMVLVDTVETWQAGPSSPILFEVTVPDNTPPGDVVYIQFSPYGWTEPLPMWPMGNHQWAYKLYGPLNMLGSFGYRFCRNALCGVADDAATPGPEHPGRLISTSLAPQDKKDRVEAWVWLPRTDPVTLVASSITPRTGFVAGVEFQPAYAPSYTPALPLAYQNVQAIGSNTLVLTPTWGYTRQSPLVFAPQPGSDPLWSDTLDMVFGARANALNVALFPTARFPGGMSAWWQSAPRDAGWWQSWWDNYRRFILNYADLAARSGAQALILGGEWVLPALPGGNLPGGGSSGAPADAEQRWNDLLAAVRGRYSGQIWWALPYSSGSLTSAPAWLGQVDGVYLLWDAALSGQPAPSRPELEAAAARLLDEELQPFQAALGKPLILAFAWPSAYGAAGECFNDGLGNCLDWTALNRPNPDVPAVTVSLQSQTDLYESWLSVVNARPWIGGFVSRGYYPAAVLFDKSASIYGKPTADILWYWFPRMLGTVR